MRYAAALVLALASCFGPATQGLTLTCTKERPACPDGLVCVDGVCGGAAVPDAAAAIDGGGVDMTPAYGCAAPGGVSLGQGVFACAGSFTTGGAAGRCASGWAPCKSATGIDLNLCNSLSGFFVADVPGAWTNNFMAPQCRSTMLNSEREVFFGCGKTGAYSFEAMNPCAGFARSLEAATVASKWFCPAFDRPHVIGDCKNDNPLDGILCCR